MRADGLASCAPLAPREGGTPPRPRKLLEGRPPLLSCAPGTFDDENHPKNHHKPPNHKNSSTSSNGIFDLHSSKHDEISEERKISHERVEKSAPPSLYSTFVEPIENIQSKKEATDQSNQVRLLSSLNNQLYPKRQLLLPEETKKECINRVPDEQDNSSQFRSTAYEIIKEEDETQTSSKVKRNPRSVEVFVHRQSLQTAREESGFNSEYFILPDNSDFSKMDHSNNYKESSCSVTPDKSSYKSFNSDSDISDRKEEMVGVFRDDISKTKSEIPLQNETSKIQSESSSCPFRTIDGCPAIEVFRESSPTPSTSISPTSVSTNDQDTPSNNRFFNHSKISPLRNNKISCRSRRNRHKSVSDHRYVSLYYSAASKNREISETEADIELHNVKDESASFKCHSPELQREAIQRNSLDNSGIERYYGNVSISSRTNNNVTSTFDQNSDAKLSYHHTIYRNHNFNRSPSYSPNNSSAVTPNQKVERNLNLYSSIDVCDANATLHKVNGQIKEFEETKCNAINSSDVSSIRATSAEISENDFPGVRGSRNSVTGGPLENFSTLCSSYSRQIPKSRSCFEYASGAGREPRPTERPRPLSLAARRGAVRHRNAEEALSCLLWQPYECREGAGAGAGGPGESGIAAGAHSLLATRYGESCAVAMRLTVPAPAHCRAVQPAQLLAHANAHVPQSEPKQVGSDPTVQITNCVASVCDERVSVSDNTVSVNGEVIGSRAVTSSCGVSQTAIQHTPRPPELARVQVVQETPCRSWASCGAQTEEPQGAPPPLAPPPYSTLPHAHPALPLPLPGQPHAYPFQPVSLRRCQYGEDSEPPKTCCGAVGARALGLKWFIVLVALAGICCVLVGTVLGAVRAQGRAHLTVLLLMIGVGLVLVTVSGVAWRAVGRRRARAGAARTGTPASGPGGAVRRGAAACARAHHPYAAMLYPEFHCRPPPPSYQASMHEYRLRLLLLDRAASPPPVACPPPAYRPRPRGMAGGGPPYMGRGARGRRRPEPRTPAPALSAVVIQNIALEPYDDIKYDDGPEMEPPIGDTKEEQVPENKEGNLVTIVQTGPDTSPVIVTVSGSMPEDRTNQTHASEIDILAHL